MLTVMVDWWTGEEIIPPISALSIGWPIPGGNPNRNFGEEMRRYSEIPFSELLRSRTQRSTLGI